MMTHGICPKCDGVFFDVEAHKCSGASTYEAAKEDQPAARLHELLNTAHLIVEDSELPQSVKDKIWDAFESVQEFVDN